VGSTHDYYFGGPEFVCLRPAMLMEICCGLVCS